MSIPYLAPAIFIFGAVLVFIGTFKMSEIEHISLLTKVKDLLLPEPLSSSYLL